jgi:hypothetical protein
MYLRPNCRWSLGGFPLPRLVFHIGPSSTNHLNCEMDFHRRKKNLLKLLTPEDSAFKDLENAFATALNKPVLNLFAEIGIGGWKGKTCPDLCINSLHSNTNDGRSLMKQITPDFGVSLCQSLMEMYSSEWVACQHYFTPVIQVECAAGSEPVIFQRSKK